MNGSQFELEVRRIARHLYADADDIRSENVDGRERDAVIRSREATYVVECTIRRDKAKIAEDAKKTKDLVQKCRTNNELARGIIVTLHEPTSDQVDACKPYEKHLEILSYERFRARLFDGAEYLNCRQNYNFGSAENLTDAKRFDLKYYVELPINDSTRTIDYKVDEFLALAKKGEAKCIVGEFGIGKSAALQHMFSILRERYLKVPGAPCPIFLNLRDHSGQTSPAEALHRHADNVGFAGKNSLVKAWRAGQCFIILDGFDELANPGWGMSISAIRQYRRSAVTIVRQFVKDSKACAPMLISGRDNYFDSAAELQGALNVEKADLFTVGLPTDSAARKIAERLGYSGALPSWLPRRPLFLAYYATTDAGTISGQALGPAEGWDMFLDRLASREADQVDIMDKQTVRRFLERLSTLARRSPDGLGGLSEKDISDTFFEIAGFVPEQQSMSLLLRMCGLKHSANLDGTRHFIDVDLAGSLKAGDIWRFAQDPFGNRRDDQPDDLMECPDITYQICIKRSQELDIGTAQWAFAAQEAQKRNNYPFISDFVRFLLVGGIDFTGVNAHVEGVQLGALTISEDYGDMSGVTFGNCLIEVLDIENIAADKMPTFTGCMIGALQTLNEGAITGLKFLSCTIESITKEGGTNQAILATGLSRQRRVLASMLRKLFMQKGAGRQRSALYRGLDQSERALVDPLIAVLVQEGYCFIQKYAGRDTVTPDRTRMHEVVKFIGSPGTYSDSMTIKADAI